MATKPKDMGEESAATVKPREMGNVAQHVRDDGSKLIEQIIGDLERITKNEVNDEEKIESIAADAISDLNVLLRALERIGAQTTPHYELENRIKKARIHLSPAMA